MKWTNKLFILLLLSFVTGCAKFLDVRPDRTATVPSTLQDGQALLDNTTIVSTNWMWLPHMYSDELFVTNSGYNSSSNETPKLNYIWNDNADNNAQWMSSYRRVNLANTVLETLDRAGINQNNQMLWDDVKGQALFLRAFSYYKLAQMFSPPYRNGDPDLPFGLPLLQTASITEAYQRSSLKETYDQIISDASQAAALLSPTPAFKTRAGKAAAFGLLARTHLLIGNYADAASNAEKVLAIQFELMDYNQINPSAAVPFQRFNKEVIYHSAMSTGLNNSVTRVDSLLYSACAADDLRKQLFFQRQADGYYSFKGNYDGQITGGMFDGITTGEMWLVLAESNAKLGKIDESLAALNKLLVNRWKTGRFVPILERDPILLLARIRFERKLELLFRGIRWSDIRRYNSSGEEKIELKRWLNDQWYRLPFGDHRFTVLIPNKVVEMGGVAQNPR